MYRYSITSLAGLVIALIVTTDTAFQERHAQHSSTSEKPAADQRLELSPTERAFIALQLVRGKHNVNILIAARKGQLENVSRKLAAISGDVSLRDTEIEFVRASVPIAQVLEVMSWPEIFAAQIDSGDEAALFAVDGPQENIGSTRTQNKPGEPPTAYTARDNPYTAESATQSLQFKVANPSWDGRGVVIGGIEPVDIRTPSLSRALSLTGTPIPKFADYVLPMPPRLTIEAVPEKGQIDYGWQQTVAVNPDKDLQVTFNGKAYLIPESVSTDELRMALVRGRPVRSVSPSTKPIASEMTILWSVRTGKVWLCEGEQTNFRKGIEFDPLPTLPHRPALAHLPHGDNRTFMVAVDLPKRALRVRYGSLYHGTMGASTAVGHTFLNSQAESIAPAAQFLPMDFGSALDQTTMQLPSLIELFRDRRVDVITNSSGMGDARRLSSRNVYRECVDRLGERYSKIMFKSAGNLGPEGIKELGFTSSRAVITVGAYTPLKTWEANFGLTPTEQNTPPSYSSYGPGSDGSLEPDLLSLTGTLCAGKPASSLSVFGASPYYQMPIDYGLSGGTSAATPNAAAHAALLISAAKQTGIPYDLNRLKIALFSSCLFLDGVEARVQGHGLIQIADAWQVLRRIKDYVAPTFVTAAPVRTYHSSQWSKPNVGRGIYERVGWSPGQNGDREITVTRTSGPRQPLTYRLRWLVSQRQSNTRIKKSPTFSSRLNEVSLPLNQAVKIPIHIQVGESGAYSAILNLIEPGLDVVVHSVMCTIIAAEQLTPDNGYTATVTRVAPHPGAGLVFINVPPETTALRIKLEQKNGKLVTLNAQTPDGGKPKVSLEPDYVPRVWQLKPSSRQAYDQTFGKPQPGVWQFWVDHENGFIDTYDPSLPRPAPACEFKITVSALGARAKTDWARSRSEMSVRFTTQLARITNAKVTPLGLGRMREEQIVLRRGIPQAFYEVVVAPGTTKLKTAVTADMETTANISLIIFRLDDVKASLVTNIGFDIGSGSEKQVEVVNPKPGTYRICLDAWGAVPENGLRVRYRDELYGPQFGKLLVADGSEKHSEKMKASIAWQVNSQAVKNQRLVAEVALVSDEYVNMSDAKAKAAQSTEVTTTSVPIAATTFILPTK